MGWFRRLFPRPRQEPGLYFVIGPVMFKTFGGSAQVALILTDEQKAPLSVIGKTQAGNPAPIHGVPTWSVSDSSIIDLLVNVDGTAMATTVGPLGTCQVSATADVDMGDGVVSKTAILDIIVQAAQATTIEIVAGTPELK